jgi:hypothetical protein
MILLRKRPDAQYSDEETARRRDEALLRALSTPPKQQSEMKLGKHQPKHSSDVSPKKAVKSGPKQKERPASKGRVQK